jgi:hypothetical protein
MGPPNGPQFPLQLFGKIRAKPQIFFLGVVNLLAALQKATTAFPMICQRIVHQSLLRVCLRPTKAEIQRRKQYAEETSEERSGQEIGEPSQMRVCQI